jgi:hypothetical protein
MILYTGFLLIMKKRHKRSSFDERHINCITEFYIRAAGARRECSLGKERSIE